MVKRRTFVDADVLIWAARGKDPLSQAAMDVLTAADREFAASDFLRLEVLPKALFHGQRAEAEFYERYLDAAVEMAPISPQLTKLAEAFAIKHGLSAVDSLHVAAAVMTRAVESVTAERPTSPLFRVPDIHIVSIGAAVSP